MKSVAVGHAGLGEQVMVCADSAVTAAAEVAPLGDVINCGSRKHPLRNNSANFNNISRGHAKINIDLCNNG